ncbi:uncharacterized protein [Malus domestica]|uniref:uncharacterized protein n=1 Tax=Malus domestica TaxID=3750 RepID=UPI003976A57D
MVELLSDYDCTIEYHHSRANSVADSLRRKSQGRLNTFYARSVPLLIELRSTGVTLGEDYQGALLANFQVRPILLDHGDQMYVPDIAELKKDILDEAHISAYAMHPGSTKIYHTIRPFYYLLGMKREIAEYVSRYAVC